jgi:queuosine precursor transporter
MVKEYSQRFLVLCVMFCTALVVSNIIAGKLWAAPLGLTLTAGATLFPIVYIIGDVLPEVYGLAATRRVIWLGFAANLFAVLFFYICIVLPYPPFWQNQTAFETVLGFTPRLLLASLLAYLAGTNVNAWIMVKMKALTSGRWLWTRTITSTIFGEGVDSTIFMLVAFVGVVPLEVLPSMIMSQALFKTIYEIIATPVTYLVIGWYKKAEGVKPVTA